MDNVVHSDTGYMTVNFAIKNISAVIFSFYYSGMAGNIKYEENNFLRTDQ